MALRFGSSNCSGRFSATCRPLSALVSMSATDFYPDSCSVPLSEGLLVGFSFSLLRLHCLSARLRHLHAVAPVSGSPCPGHAGG